MALPKRTELYNPVLHALITLDGPVSLVELEDAVAKGLSLTDEEASRIHDGRRTVLGYEIAWVLDALKRLGLLDNNGRGVWWLTEQGRETTNVDRAQVDQSVHEQPGTGRHSASPEADGSIAAPESSTDDCAAPWREELMKCLLELPPNAFERLCQRLLRESGCVEVTVTGRSGDGGIDGVGIMRVGGLLGFRILFQCKRYKGIVGPGTIRDLRGAMGGRADHGIVLTTGTFSGAARLEATRDGVRPIDLVDGDQVLDKLKELGLGVTVTHVEHVSVKPAFFESI